METRIRIIWVFSLVSAALLIGVQGYWLYNQYVYVVSTYSEELAEKILQAGEKEYTLRKEEVKSSYTYLIHQNTEYFNKEKEDLPRQRMFFSIDKLDIPKSKADSSRLSPHGMPEDTLIFHLSINPKLSPDSMHTAIGRAVTNINNPFREALLDSVLTAELGGMPYTITPWIQADTILYQSYWEVSDKLLHPGITVFYAYSPFEKKGVVVEASIQPQPLFGKMAVQLLLAFGLILLLIGCLIFQIKTILKQRKISELRESFVNTMIHELKRPVQTLKTFVAFLGDKELRLDEAATQQVVHDSMFELDNLSAYLNKLKDMIRADNESTPLHPVKFNLEELTEKVIRLAHIPAGKRVELSARYEMESPWIAADPVHIANILSNLIENAIKYSGNDVAIEVKAIRKGKELWLTVSDNGIGIPYAEQEKVFAKFYRATNLPVHDIPGIGLGLSYVKLITEAHHGNVSLSSHIGKGTSVTLYLPQ